MLIKIVKGGGLFPYGPMTDATREFLERNVGNVFRANRIGDNYYEIIHRAPVDQVHKHNVMEVDDKEIGWRDDGEANFFTFSNGKTWVGRIQFNGEVTSEKQWITCRKLAETLTKVAKGEL